MLSWGRDDEVVIPPQAMRAVLAAARRLGGVVVVDLPRRVDEGVAEALAQLDLGLLVVPGELRAVAAARRVAATAGMVLDDLRVVPRGPYASGLDGRWVARAIGLPLVGELPVESGLLVSQDDGTPPGGSARGPLARFCSAFWEQVAAAGDASPVTGPPGGGAA